MADFATALEAALAANEIGGGDPYALSFAHAGDSGASIGRFQADLHVNPVALAAVNNLLGNAGLDPARVTELVGQLSLAWPAGSDMAPADLADINAALASDAGHAMVDRLDARSLAVVQAALQQCIAAAATAGNTITDAALIPLGLWINMSGPPTLLLSWLNGAGVGFCAPPGNPVNLDDTLRYVQSTGYERNHPQTWPHFTASVAVGTAMLAGSP